MMEPQVDSWVLTADGRPIGRIKRVSDGTFLVDVAGEPDYWLRSDEVEGIGQESVQTVRMRFDAEELEQHRIKYGE